MRKIKLISKLLGGINVLALMLVFQTANSACIWMAYQPKFPEEANNMKKQIRRAT